MAIQSDGKKSHRYRKNPRSHELYKEENKRQNAERSKQRWVSAAIDTGRDSSPSEGYWTREAL